MKIDFHAPDMVLLAGVLLVLASAWILWRRQNKRIFVWWRLATIGVFVVLLAQPSSVQFRGNTRPLVAVAGDVSPSMFMSGRADAVRDFLRERLGDMDKAWDVRFYRFSRTAENVKDAVSVTGARPRSPTDIGRSLWEIRRDAGEQLAGMIVLSDFNHNADAPGSGWVSELNVPVFPVAAGTNACIRDLSIESVRISDFAFKNVPVDITAQVGARGARGAVVTVRLKNAASGAAIAVQQMRISDEKENREVVLRYTPGMGGRVRLAVEVDPIDGELTGANNRKECALDVLRDKIRVLYLCGQPGPEYAFLRHTLKSDPAVELVSFVILRNPDNIALVPDNDLSLIPFPVHDLFTRDLYDFDALILENFTYQRFGFQPEYLKNIKTWVTEKGGGLIMIAGRNSFGAGGWGGTPVEDILPVILEKPQERFEEGSFSPVITNSGHFVMEINEDKAKNEASWKSIPGLDGCQPVSVRPGAELLARHPWNNWAVLCAWEKGKGRVVSLGSNTTWRWALGSATPELYTRFWKNIVRYLARSVESRQLRMMFDRLDYASGDSFAVKIRSIESSAGHMLRVTMIDPSGKRTAISPLKEGEKEWICRGSMGDPGTYRFEAVLEKNGVVAGRDESVLSVESALHGEESVFDVNDALAGAIARESAGEYFTAATINTARVNALLKKCEPKEKREKKPLWASPFILIALAASLAGEWFMRKRKGLA